jgi:hypothetical protein
MTTTQTEAERYAAGAFDGVLMTLDHTGDTRVMWDRHNPAEVDIAKAAFAKAQKSGALIYKAEGKKGERGEQIREFDPDVERMVVVPRIVGG